MIKTITPIDNTVYVERDYNSKIVEKTIVETEQLEGTPIVVLKEDKKKVKKLEKEIAQLKTKLTGAENTANFNQDQVDNLLPRLNSGVNIEEFTDEEQEFLQNYLSRQDVLGG